MYLLGGSVYPLVTVDPGVNISNLTLNGIALVKGTNGFYWNDTSAANHVQAINAAGSGYVPGEIITLAGGTFTSAITIRVVQIGGGGSITLAAVLNPGIYTVLPTYPASQASTTGVGTGATFTCSNVVSNGLSITNSRSEQATNAASSSIYISPSSAVNNVTIANFYFDGGRKGVFLRRALHTTIANTLYAPAGATLAVDADTTNECLEFQNCKWLAGATSSIGLSIVMLSSGPTGETSNALAPWALFGNNPVTPITFTTLNINNAVVFTGSISGSFILKGPPTASGTLTFPAGTTDFSATGGTSRVVKQTSAGGAFTVAQLANTDITGLGTAATQNMGTSGATIPLLNVANNWSATQSNSAGWLSTSPSIGVGYATGAGGTVTQTVNKGNPVTLNKMSGQITMHNAALAGNTTVPFLLNNSSLVNGDTVTMNIITGYSANGAYQAWAEGITTGSCVINFRNITAGSLSEAIVLGFVIIKGATS